VLGAAGDALTQIPSVEVAENFLYRVVTLKWKRPLILTIFNIKAWRCSNQRLGTSRFQFIISKSDPNFWFSIKSGRETFRYVCK
jgi:hypothetical protein